MYNEIYFWLYTYLSRIKTNKTPAFNAYLILSVLHIFNLGTLLIWINYFLKYNIERQTAVYLGLILALIFAFINYFIYYARRENIIKKYNEHLSHRKTWGQIYFWLYVVFSFIVFFVSVSKIVNPKY